MIENDIRIRRGLECGAALETWLETHGLERFDDLQDDALWERLFSENAIGRALDKSAIETYDPRDPIDLKALNDFMKMRGRLLATIYWPAQLYQHRLDEQGMTWGEASLDTESCLIPNYWLADLATYVRQNTPQVALGTPAGQQRAIDAALLGRLQRNWIIARRGVARDVILWSFVLDWWRKELAAEGPTLKAGKATRELFVKYIEENHKSIIRRKFKFPEVFRRFCELCDKEGLPAPTFTQCENWYKPLKKQFSIP